MLKLKRPHPIISIRDITQFFNNNLRLKTMNNEQRNDMEESKDVDVNLTMPQQRDSSNQEGQQQEASAAQPEPTSDNEFEEDGTHKTREGQEEGEEDNDQNYHFYKEYCRLYYANIILTNRL